MCGFPSSYATASKGRRRASPALDDGEGAPPLPFSFDSWFDKDVLRGIEGLTTSLRTTSPLGGEGSPAVVGGKAQY